ncbi:WD40/YVTN/BNR-like repeat-containing protein [Metabacillus litoralis]|uniref:WD40/YVTN/BNR-like repeat-containing protein n=1 Tax=Metabacillus litoralis TaxID=152268 RepID=UPI001CFF0B8D|nr:oxidoreductase [Metabacillus litoralis]
MKKLILGVSFIMIISLVLVMIRYQNAPQTSLPNFNQESKNDLKKPQVEELQPIDPIKLISYSLQNEKLHITFDKGKNWIKVPVDHNQLFYGDYHGNKKQLIENSYIITNNRIAFIYSDHHKVLLSYSTNQGKTWDQHVITEQFTAIRFRKVEFLNDTFGYIIISGNRTMSQESSHVFLTTDAGENWNETTNSGITRLISDGGFIDVSTGFLSFGTINPQEPDLYFTHDSGNSWKKATFLIPEKYKQIFVSAEIPVKENDGLAVLVNQGPNGDYKGGNVKGKFISKDSGKTWEFSMEVSPNETENME